ncbi:hypothetical protein DSLASN_45400 [Desulfoluna limicola]|uniref:Uncharacterized protein n=1 Tax=Desulfoluna limicola TaxID=2810562 RepID=A0ABM7PNN5_9BACT|nr:hypothetical protein DSLASN_45400 [Desulfoluna limicola]
MGRRVKAGVETKAPETEQHVGENQHVDGSATHCDSLGNTGGKCMPGMVNVPGESEPPATRYAALKAGFGCAFDDGENPKLCINTWLANGSSAWPQQAAEGM